MLQPLPKPELAHLIRARLPGLLLDVSGMPPSGFAIYTLSDPRDLRHVRYVGQTRLPRRRLLQHLADQHELLNFERDLLARQSPLL